MSFAVTIGGIDFECELIRSRRKSVAIKLLPGKIICVKCPYFVSRAQIKLLLESRAEHIIKACEKAENAPAAIEENELKELKKQAREDMTRRVEHYAAVLNLEYGRIAIRAQKSRWGSCSGKKNLNFNCLLMLCPETVRDYVAVHELCHLREMNHSARFWTLVESVCPDYRESRKWLRENGGGIIERIR